MLCPNCGKMLQAGKTFCSVCGTKVIKDKSDVPEETPANTSKGKPFDLKNASSKLFGIAKSVGSSVNDATGGKAGDLLQTAQKKIKVIGEESNIFSSGKSSAKYSESKEEEIKQETPSSEDIKPEKKSPLQPVQVLPQSDADELRKFKQLLDDGIITEEEYNAKKKQILGI